MVEQAISLTEMFMLNLIEEYFQIKIKEKSNNKKSNLNHAAIFKELIEVYEQNLKTNGYKFVDEFMYNNKQL